MAFKKEVKITCDYTDIENIIREEFGTTYEIMPMEEVGSSQYAAVYERNVAIGKLDSYENETIENLYFGKTKQFTLDTILKHLANKELLEEGSYIIDVSW